MAWKQLNLNRFLSPSFVLNNSPRFIRCEPTILLLNLKSNNFITDIVYNKNQYSRIHRMWQVTTEPKFKDRVKNPGLLDTTIDFDLMTDYCLPVLDISYLDYPFKKLEMNFDGNIVRFKNEEKLDEIKAELENIENIYKYKLIEPPAGYMIGTNHFIFFKNEGWFEGYY